MESFELKNQIKVQRAIKNMTQAELATEIGVTRKQLIQLRMGNLCLQLYWQ